MAVGSNRVKLDLNSPEFQDVFFRLELSELKQVVGSLRRLAELDWNALYRHTGFNWEAVRHIRTPNRVTAYSLRIISLHPDHDSAYGR